MGKLDGKVAIVTGAAMGNGEGIARVMAQHGAKVMLWDISEKLFETTQDIASKGGYAKAFKVDITNVKACHSAADQIIAEEGRIDILCNNAGVARLALFEDMSDELRDFHFSVNFFGAWNATKAVLLNMKKNRYGKIINMSSVTGPLVVDPGMAAYAASKSALLGFTKAVARDLAPFGINVNAICPGYILTPMVEHTARESNPSSPETVIDGIAAGVPLGRLGKPSEIGDLAAFLASDESAYITGTQIVIDGGSTLPETMTVGV
jgi:hypothetical protein